MMRLKVSPFMNCCGIQIIYNFGNSSDVNPIYTVAETSKAVSDIILEGYRDPNYQAPIPPGPPYNYAMQLVSLNTQQHKKLHKMMIRKGFKLIDKGWNLNHRNMNYLYSLHLEEGRKTYDLK